MIFIRLLSLIVIIVVTIFFKKTIKVIKRKGEELSDYELTYLINCLLYRGVIIIIYITIIVVTFLV